LESLAVISVAGFLAGIMFSMPVWGPVSIFIATNGLQGRWRYCVAAAAGSGTVDVLVCFIAVLGFVKLLGVVAHILPYLFLAGAVVLFALGVRIIKTKIDLEGSGPDKSKVLDRVKARKTGGFLAGLLINGSNPSIIFGWLTASFIVISFVAFLGFNVNGLDRTLGNNVAFLKGLTAHHHAAAAVQAAAALKGETARPVYAGIAYSVSVGAGTVAWFSFFSYLLSQWRARFPLGALRKTLQGLGALMCALAVFFAVRSVMLFVGN
jgi:threonine/homoserine/homoserine lactone efflux protein